MNSICSSTRFSPPIDGLLASKWCHCKTTASLKLIPAPANCALLNSLNNCDHNKLLNQQQLLKRSIGNDIINQCAHPDAQTVVCQPSVSPQCSHKGVQSGWMCIIMLFMTAIMCAATSSTLLIRIRIPSVAQLQAARHLGSSGRVQLQEGQKLPRNCSICILCVCLCVCVSHVGNVFRVRVLRNRYYNVWIVRPYWRH